MSAVASGFLSALRGLGFSFAAGGEPFVDLDDEDALAAVVRSQTTITARDAEGRTVKPNGAIPPSVAPAQAEASAESDPVLIRERATETRS